MRPSEGSSTSSADRGSSQLPRLQHELPPEILDNVLSRLPLQVLCRFRLVCKQWNHLLTQPAFAALCAQAPRRTPYVLVSPKVVYFDPRESGRVRRPMNTEGCTQAGMNLSRVPRSRNWEILDMAEKRFYSLSDSFMDDYLYSEKTIKEDCVWDRQTLAADGGLIYALYHGWIHVLCNPLRKSFVRIEDPGFCFNHKHHLVVMSADPATEGFKIVVIESKTRARGRSEKVYLYDSTAAPWRQLCGVPVHHRACSCVFLKGVFYTLFADSSMIPRQSKLFSCDLETGTWSHIDVTLPRPSHLQDKAQLVVISDRLFFVEYTGLPEYPNNGVTNSEAIFGKRRRIRDHHIEVERLITVRLSEILLADKEVIRVGEELKYSEYPLRMLALPHHIVGNPVVAVGCGDWIVISSLLRRRVGFDLVKKDWQELPADTGHMYDSVQQGASDYQGMYGGVVDLDLRELTWESRPRKGDGMRNSRSEGVSGS